MLPVGQPKYKTKNFIFSRDLQFESGVGETGTRENRNATALRHGEFLNPQFLLPFFSDFFVLFVGLQNLLLALPPRKSAGRRFSSCNLISFFALFFFPVL
jgi:hypothetical protein